MDLYNKIRYVCSKQKECFPDCPMRKMPGCLGIKDPDKWPDKSKIEPLVDKWIEDHQVKTRQTEFLKMFPGAVKMVMDNNQVVVAICPCAVDDTFDKSMCARVNCDTCKKEYWSQEIEG